MANFISTSVLSLPVEGLDINIQDIVVSREMPVRKKRLGSACVSANMGDGSIMFAIDRD
jgi:hypothetical protein